MNWKLDYLIISNALSERDSLSRKRGILEHLVRSASIKQYRVIDTKIQGHNWLVDLVE